MEAMGEGRPIGSRASAFHDCAKCVGSVAVYRQRSIRAKAKLGHERAAGPSVVACLTRLTNGFSKKIENLAAAISLHFAYYNFCRVHTTLGTTPAVAAGVTDHVWTLAELVGLLEAAESQQQSQ